MTRKASFLIPRFLPNGLFLFGAAVLRWLEGLRRGKTTKTSVSAGAGAAAAGIASAARVQDAPASGYIENQLFLGGIPYGRYTVARSGCGAIALYNALRQLGAPQPLFELLREMETDGLLRGGRLGTAHQALRDALRRRGFACEMSRRHRDLEAFSRRYPCLLLTCYNDQDDLAADIHTFHIEKSAAGFTAQNALGDGAPLGPFASVSELFAAYGQRPRLICFLGVSRRGEGQPHNEEVPV